MSVYYLIIILILIPAYPLCIKNPTEVKKTVYTVIVFSTLFLVCGLRYGVGVDYYADNQLFSEISRSSFFGVFSHNVEPGFVFLTLVISRISDSFVLANLMYSAVIILPAAIIIRRYSVNLWLSCYIYFCASLFFAAMSFTRQSIAASILLTAYGYIKDKEIIPVFFITIIAALFHVSALLFLPIFLISLVKPAKHFYIALGLFAIELFILFKPLISVVSDLISERKGEAYSGYAKAVDIIVSEPFFIVMPFVICALTLTSYFLGWRKREEPTLFHAICSVACLIVWIFSLRLAYAERFSCYFMIFSVLGIPSAVDYFVGDFNEIVLVIDSLGDELKQKLFKCGKNSRRLYLRGRKNKFYAMLGLFLVFCLVCNNLTLTVYASKSGAAAPYNSAINHVEFMRYRFSQSKIKELKSETDMRNYLIKLRHSGFSYIISVNPDENIPISQSLSDAFRFIGITGEFLTEKNFRKCFVFVGEKGKMIYKNLDTVDIAYYSARLCGYMIDIYSKSDYSGIEIKGVNYSLNNKGVNITVFNDQDGAIVDKISYTLSGGQPVIIRTAKE